MRNGMEAIIDIYKEDDKYYEYIEDYKNCAIYRELKLKVGNFIAFDNDDKQVCKELTIKLIRKYIDLTNNKETSEMANIIPLKKIKSLKILNP